MLVLLRSKPLQLWLVAVILMVCAVIYQRRTGPTYPLRGIIKISEHPELKYKLIRSEETGVDAKIVLPGKDFDIEAKVYFKRYKTSDSFTQIPLVKMQDEYVADLPTQPPAGKLEYFVEIKNNDRTIRIPESQENIVIRFKGHVPPYILWPHIIMMFFSVLIGMRAGLSALFSTSDLRKWSWTALVGMTLGGMVLGPIVQKFAFGEYWTGFPWGRDLTDNKMLIMWLAWFFACLFVGFKPNAWERYNRLIVMMAAVVMMVVYLIPHSLKGSELDYSKVDQGVPAQDAIKTSE